MDELKKLLHLLVNAGAGRLLGEAEQAWARNVIETHPLLNGPAEAEPAADGQEQPAAEGAETGQETS